MQGIALLTKEPQTYDSKSFLDAIRRSGAESHIVDYSSAHAQEDLSSLNPRSLVVRHVPAFLEEVIDLVEKAEEMGVVVSASAESIRLANDKARVAEVMSEQGVPMPRTVLISSVGAAIDEVRSNFSGKVVLKPVDGALGSGIHLVDTEDDSWGVLLDTKRRYIAQEYIEESHGSDVRIFIVDGQIIASMERKSKGSLQSNLHAGGTAMNVEIDPEEAALALASAKILGAKVVGVDILRSKRGPLLLELNTSPGLRGIEKTTGCDVAGAVVSALAN